MIRWARRRHRTWGFLGTLGSAAFFTAWFGLLIFAIVGHLSDLNTKRELRQDSVSATGIALTTESEQWHDDEGTYVVYRTKIGYVVGADRHVAEIPGKFSEGESVPIVYDPDNPEVIRTASSLQGGSIAGDIVGIAFMLAMVVFGIGFAISWYRFNRF